MSASSAQKAQDGFPIESGVNVDELRPLVEPRLDLQVWQFCLVPICGMLVMFSVPSMTYSLYKNSLIGVLQLTPHQSQLIVSCGLLGGMVLGFVPGIIYDRFGYTVTLAAGGAMAVTGASLWFVMLSGGGAPGSPSSLKLALSLMLMCHGCRTQYFAGMCALLCAFPKQLVGYLSAAMAILLSCGYVILPLLWRHVFLPSDPLAFDAEGRLRNLEPVAGFYRTLATIYAAVTLAGLSIAPWLPKRDSSSGAHLSSWGDRARKLRDPEAAVLLVFVMLSLSLVYTFMTSGVAGTSSYAGASSTDVAKAVSWMGGIGLVGRFVLGFGAQLLQNYTPARRAGLYLMFFVASASVLTGFLLLLPSPGLNMDRWLWACYCISFGFGGYFALFPATTRDVFGPSELGFWLGLLFCMVGSLNFFAGLFAATVHWQWEFFTASVVGTAIVGVLFAFMVLQSWGKASVAK